MEKWQIKYWCDAAKQSPIQKWLDGLEEDQLKSISKELIMLEITGNMLRLPHSRALGQGLFELRDIRYGLRIYYGFHGRQIIIVVAAGDKGGQEKDIKMARNRLSQTKSEEKL